ncbi:MAG: alkaline phosphatase family protein [Polyangiales bacterium]
MTPRLGLLAACALAAACGLSHPAPGVGVAPDVAADEAAVDVAPPPDVAPDRADAAPDIALDATPDVALDAAPDAPPDVALDAAPDVALDVRDAAPDLPVVPDAPPDVARDAPPPLDAVEAGVDRDGDGYPAGVDCDDNDRTRNPGVVAAVRVPAMPQRFTWVGQASMEATLDVPVTERGCAVFEAQTSVPWLAAAYDAAAGRLTLRVNGARVTGGVSSASVVIRDTAGMRDAGAVPVQLRALGSPDPTQPHKVLVVGVDGVRADLVPAATMPNLAALRGFGQWIPRATTQRTAATLSGPGWASVLTGVEPTKHRITANANYASRDPAWPTFLSRARNGLRLRTSVAAHWPDILQLVEPDALDERSMGDDLTVANAMAATLRAGSADVHFVHLDDVDHAGHTTGFSAANPNYVAALQGADDNLGRMLDGLFERPTLAREFWLVVFVTDHGGEGTSHGAMNAANQEIPVGYLGPGATFALPTRGALSHLDVHPTVMHFLGATPTPAWRLDGRDLYAPFESLCADGTDDDGDGSVDCADPDCASETSCACVVADAGSALGRAIATGTMAGRADTARGSCGGAGLLDAAVTWTAPSAGTFSFDTAGSDRNNNTWLHVHRAACNGPELACNDTASGIQAAARVALNAGERVVVVVESANPTLPWMLNARDVSRCPDRDLGSATGRVASGTVGAVGGSLFANCAQSGRDVTFQWTAPSTGAWRFDTFGSDYDTVLHVRDGACGATILGCSDDYPGAGYASRVDLGLAAGRTVTVVVSGFNARPEGPGALPGGGTGAYVLNINRP